jgi:hypothetical protein
MLPPSAAAHLDDFLTSEFVLATFVVKFQSRRGTQLLSGLSVKVLLVRKRISCRESQAVSRLDSDELVQGVRFLANVLFRQEAHQNQLGMFGCI